MWRKSSFSTDNGTCIEVADWFKSSHSVGADTCIEAAWIKSSASTGNGACVETQWQPDGILVRDSKNPDGPVLAFVRDQWTTFIEGVKAGEFDR